MNRYLPIAAACASTMIGGSVAVATRSVVEVVDPVSVGLIRYGIALACLVPAALYVGRFSMARGDLVAMAAIGIMFFSIFPVGFSTAFKYTTASQGALVFSLTPVLNMIFAALLKQETLTEKKIMGGICVVVGVAVVVDLSGTQAKDPLLGNSIMFGMAVLGAIFNILARPYLQRYNQLQATTWFLGCGWVALLIASLILAGMGTGLVDLVVPPKETWLLLVLMGTFGGAISVFLFNWALGHIESTLVSVALGLSPLTAAILGVLILSEPFSLSLVVGLSLVIAGITLPNWQRRALVLKED